MLKITNYILEKEQLRVLLEVKENFTEEIIEIKDGEAWIPILKSSNGSSTLRMCSKKVFISKLLNFFKRTKKKLYFQLDDEDFNLNLDYCLEEENIHSPNSIHMHIGGDVTNSTIIVGNDNSLTELSI